MSLAPQLAYLRHLPQSNSIPAEHAAREAELLLERRRLSREGVGREVLGSLDARIAEVRRTGHALARTDWTVAESAAAKAVA